MKWSSDTSMETTMTDRRALNKILADGVRLAFQWDKDEQEKSSWIILESGLLPPTVVTQINEVAAWIRAAKGKMNPLIKSLFENDDKLHANIIRICNLWHLTIPSLMGVKDKELYKTMRVAYTRHVRMNDAPNEMELPCSKQSLGIHLAGTALSRTGLRQRYSGALMNLRSILRHAHPVETGECVYCSGHEHHTVIHVISRCSFPPTQRRRAVEISGSTKAVGYCLTNLSTTLLAGILGGPHPDEITLDERTRACEAALAIFQTSPLFHPPRPV
jgi:hypothetical protein